MRLSKLFILLLAAMPAFAQRPYAKLSNVDLGAVQWTSGFRAERFEVCKNAMVPHLWQNTLYKEMNNTSQPVSIKLIPYYAWANRGRSDMSVWLPVSR